MAALASMRGDPSAIAAYKNLVKAVLDLRPSGTRQRLAVALGKNRSFVSQIANPAYPMPIPAQHLETLFEICHFSDLERKRFLDLYGCAHPGRLRLAPERAATRRIALDIPDLGSAERNAAVEALFETMASNLARILEDAGSNH